MISQGPRILNIMIINTPLWNIILQGNCDKLQNIQTNQYNNNFLFRSVLLSLEAFSLSLKYLEIRI